MVTSGYYWAFVVTSGYICRTWLAGIIMIDVCVQASPLPPTEAVATEEVVLITSGNSWVFVVTSGYVCRTWLAGIVVTFAGAALSAAVSFSGAGASSAAGAFSGGLPF